MCGAMGEGAKLREERRQALGAEPSPAERGPVVRWSWQRNQGTPGPEKYLQAGAGAGLTPEFDGGGRGQ